MLSAYQKRGNHVIRRTGARLAMAILRRLSVEDRARAVDALLSTPVIADTPNGPISFLNHGRGSCKRALTILTKEPDSLQWIDAMRPGAVFWDIGANVGVLTLYAAARGDIDVWAFEPAAVNYYNLVANCELNRLENCVRCLQLGFSDTSEIADLHVSQLLSAYSFSFREQKDLKKPRERRKVYPSLQAVQLSTIDDFLARYDVPCPNYIKIDVPGLTPEILNGARHTLSRSSVEQIQVEAKEHGNGGRRIVDYLAEFGFTVVKRGMKRDGQVQGDLVFARESWAAQPRRSYDEALPNLAKEDAPSL